MMRRSKRYRNISQNLDRAKVYPLVESIDLVKRNAQAKFDETVELIANLGIDPKKADQQVRGTVSLPSGTGQTVRVLVFAEGDAAKQAQDAGADFVGADDIAKKIQEGWTDFDVAIATPDMMRVVGRLGKILGPRGLMPNPKTGTVTTEVARTIQEFKAGKIEYRADRTGGIHVRVGKASFSPQQLLDNIRVVIDALLRARPTTAKGQYVKSLFLCSTMSPSVRLDINEVREAIRGV
ncbi:MAG TPA: 50S ribosomal protein L1 [bacterium]|nr:50S ribosomal protein L1 [bacterium]HPO08220.1 50S ribosomal protein L1 [bacterium]HQO33084.1 50S ribosomal protein L1 [bacterium]HQP97233.1 50S ribosomal protein L1 [bacterium]